MIHKLVLSLILTLGLLLPASMAVAAPFLVCDPNPIAEGVTHYELKPGTGAEFLVPADPTRTYGFKYDLEAAPSGTTIYQIKAVRVHATQGTAKSAATSYTLVKPTAPGAVAQVRLELVGGLPFVVSNPNPVAEGVTDYEVTVGTAAPVLVAADPTRTYGLKFDTASFPVGAVSLSIKAVKVDPTWGQLKGAAVPFSYTKLGAPGSIVGVRVVQN